MLPYRPVTLDEIRHFLAFKLLADFLSEAEITEAQLLTWHRDGIPVEWARQFEKASGLPVSAWPTTLHGPRLLTKRRQLSRVVNVNMDNSHKLAISRSRSRGTSRDPFSAACRKAGLTRGGLARALDIDPALLSRYRKGTRPIPQERADKVKALTGWPADKAHWPGGIVPLD